MGFKLLSVFTYACSITYYVSDNVLWVLNVLVKSKVLDKAVSRSWKRRKNFSSLYRVLAYTLILFYSIHLQSQENDSHQGYLQGQSEAAESNIELED